MPHLVSVFISSVYINTGSRQEPVILTSSLHGNGECNSAMRIDQFCPLVAFLSGGSVFPGIPVSWQKDQVTPEKLNPTDPCGRVSAPENASGAVAQDLWRSVF